MQTITANEAKTRFGEDDHRMRTFHAERLRRTLRQSAEEAAAKGLTDEALEALLNGHLPERGDTQV